MKHILVAAIALYCMACRADWQYTNDVDVMTSKTTSFAMTRSVNSLDLTAPYRGENHGTLVIRKKSGAINVIFGIDKGQIICDYSDGCSVAVRFDDAKAVRFAASKPSDHSSDKLFIKNESKFVAAASRAKRILVAVTIYQAGQQVLEFTSATPLSWQPLK